MNTFHPYAPTYERARQLQASGCPLDYAAELPRKINGAQSGLHITQLGGFSTSRVFDFGNSWLGYVIALRFDADLQGEVVVSDWSVAVPWKHFINWEYEPCDVIPRPERPAYAHLFDARLLGVLNEGHALNRGYPV
jgi:hypothetical protein